MAEEGGPDSAYSPGELVRVGWAANQAEAELLQGLLRENGVPSTVRRSRGFDVPDFLAGGPRDIMVPAAGAELARELLGGAASEPAPGGPAASTMPPGRIVAIAAVLLVLAVAVVLAAWLLAGG